MSHPELEFFNSVTGNLEIELTEPPEQIADLLNQRATPDARITSLSLKPEFYDPETDDFRPLTSAELESLAFEGKSIKLRSESGHVVEHQAPDGEFFTVRQLLAAVEETERQTRDRSEWLGGVDVHHCFFEGIHPDEEDDDVWEIYWGS